MSKAKNLLESIQTEDYSNLKKKKVSNQDHSNDPKSNEKILKCKKCSLEIHKFKDLKDNHPCPYCNTEMKLIDNFYKSGEHKNFSDAKNKYRNDDPSIVSRVAKNYNEGRSHTRNYEKKDGNGELNEETKSEKSSEKSVDLRGTVNSILEPFDGREGEDLGTIDAFNRSF